MKTKPQRGRKPPTASLVIRGPSTKYVNGLHRDGFAVVHAHTLYIVGPNVHGTFYDNQGRCGQFDMPLCAFEELEYLELGSEENEVEETDAEDEDDLRPKAA